MRTLPRTVLNFGESRYSEVALSKEAAPEGGRADVRGVLLHKTLQQNEPSIRFKESGPARGIKAIPFHIVRHYSPPDGTSRTATIFNSISLSLAKPFAC